MTPDSPNPPELDALDRALKGLPQPRAPRTLLPRVMAAAAVLNEDGQRTARSATTWFMWPRALQAASLAALVLLVGGIVWLWPSANEVVGTPLAAAFTVVWTWTVEIAWSAAAVVSLTSIMWESFCQPLVPYLLVWIVLMSAACAAFGAALGRVALGGASHS